MYNAIIVEDDPVVAKLNSFYLESYKEITLFGTFRNATDALSFIRKNKTDLILLDYHLPGMSGREFLAKIREIDSHIEVIVITMDNDISAIRALLNYGVIDFILKPYSYKRFNESISQFLTKSAYIRKDMYLSQAEIDDYLYKTPRHNSEAVKKTEKGIQNETREQILAYLKKQKGQPLTLKQILTDIPLSRVTVRRYMNYFSNEGIVSVKADYSTGGRPSMIYTYHEQ